MVIQNLSVVQDVEIGVDEIHYNYVEDDREFQTKTFCIFSYFEIIKLIWNPKIHFVFQKFLFYFNFKSKKKFKKYNKNTRFSNGFPIRHFKLTMKFSRNLPHFGMPSIDSKNGPHHNHHHPG